MGMAAHTATVGGHVRPRGSPALLAGTRRRLVITLAIVAALAGGAALSRTIGAAAHRTAPARPSAPAPAVPALQVAELRYETKPVPGVWAELKVILDNPLPGGSG